MTTKINLKELSKFVLLFCNKNDISINHFKLQKLLFYIQAWHLVYFDGKVLFNEEPEAWVNGPVYRTVYNDFKRWFATVNLKYTGDIDAQIKEALDALKLTKEQVSFMASLLNHYGLMTHEKLIILTHQEKPWNEARQGLGEFDYSNNKISLKSMYDYYSQLRSNNKETKVG